MADCLAPCGMVVSQCRPWSFCPLPERTAVFLRGSHPTYSGGTTHREPGMGLSWAWCLYLSSRQWRGWC